MQTEPLDSRTQEEVIQALCARLESSYVFPETAVQLSEVLAQRLERGVFNEIREGDAFAAALNDIMQETSGDRHLRMRWLETALPEQDGSLLQNQEKLAEMKLRVKLDNFGFHKAERLAGNIGLLEIRHFVRPSWGSGETAAAAMNLLSSTGALLFDLRQCGGGNPGMVALLSSYLFDGEPVLLNTLYWREGDCTEQYWTLPYVPGTRFIDKPVYILTSSYTFSAGEEFAYNLQQLGRAVVVGETTAGGAHPGSPFRLHAHFDVFIPTGRAINPISSSNWEGAGVAPDHVVPAAQAFHAAYRMALEEVLASIGQETSGPYCRLREEILLAGSASEGKRGMED